MPRIVAFTGPIGSGKTTAAKAMERLQYKKVSFADPLKEMLMAFGLTWAQVYGDEKEIPLPILANRTPRYAMQTLGTEWGRDLIHKDLWTLAWQHKIQQYQKVTVDDARFPNEFAMIKALGGTIVRIFRPFADIPQTSHESERYESEIPYDFIMKNDKSEKEFALEVQRFSWT